MDFAAIGTALAQSKLLDKVGGEKGAAVKELIGGDKVEGLKGLLGKKKPAEAAPAAPATTGTDAAPADASCPCRRTKITGRPSQRKSREKT